MKNSFLNPVPTSIFVKKPSEEINLHPTGPPERLPWHSHAWGTSSPRRGRRIRLADSKRLTKRHRRQQLADFAERRNYAEIVSVRVLRHLEAEPGNLLAELVYEGKLDGRSGHTPSAILKAAGFSQKAIVEIYIALEQDEPIPTKGVADAELVLFNERTKAVA